MYFHVRITQKSNSSHDETKLDLSEEQLRERFIEFYELGEAIIINGKTIPAADLERIRISASEEDSKPLIAQARANAEASSVIVIGGASDEWHAADLAKDVTDELIRGAPGYRKKSEDKRRLVPIPAKVSGSSKKVFVVHGYDHALKSDVEVFLRDLGLEPVVLHREVDEGRTLIEKFERHSDVAYALVLLTPDDVGCSAEEMARPETERIIEQRARQNVIFELGFFAGRLGRERLCCVYKLGVSPPSDLNGFVYKEIKSSIEEVGYSLIKEFKAAGLPVTLRSS